MKLALGFALFLMLGYSLGLPHFALNRLPGRRSRYLQNTATRLVRNLFGDTNVTLPSNQPDFVMKPITVSVYFESLCPDSWRYFANKLHPAMRRTEMQAMVILDFVSFGNAQVEADESKQTYNFDCQHGPEECQGNIEHVCFLNVTGNLMLSLDFYTCTFKEVFGKERTASDAAETCAKSLISEEQRSEWTLCASTKLGRALHAEMGTRTETLKPPQTFIPWTTFNGVGSDDINRLTLREFEWVTWLFWNYFNLQK